MPSTCRGNIRPQKYGKEKESLICEYTVHASHSFCSPREPNLFLFNLYLLSKISFSFIATVPITNLCENDIVVEKCS